MNKLLNIIYKDIQFYYEYLEGDIPFAPINLNINSKKIFLYFFNKSNRFLIYIRVSNSIKNRFIKKILFWYINTSFCCDISPDAKIGPRVFFPHPFGIVIGQKVIIDGSSIIFNNITIGKKYPGTNAGMPHIGKNVIICVGARILGKIFIANNSIIGANAVITKANNCSGTYTFDNRFHNNTYFGNFK